MIEKTKGRGMKLADFGEWSPVLATAESQAGRKWTAC
jgi:hypothetical protein